MKIFLSLAGMTLFIPPLSAGTDKQKITAHLRYTRQIKIPADSPKPELIQFPLDAPVYEHSEGISGQFRDLRVISSSGEEVPFRITKEFTRSTRSEKILCNSVLTSIKTNPDNSIVISITRNKTTHPYPEYIVFDAGIKGKDSKNFDKKITLERSTDGEKWIPVPGEYSIFDYSEIIPLSNRTIRIPKAPARFFRVTIQNFSETKFSRRTEVIREFRSSKEFSEIRKNIRTNPLFHISDIKLYALQKKNVIEAPRIKDASAEILSRKDTGKYTDIILNLHKQPLCELRIKTDSANFARNITVSKSNDKATWNQISSGAISKISIGGINRNKMRLTIPETAAWFLRLRIHNGNSPPLENISVQCRAAVYNVQFILKAPAANLKLYYGGDIPKPKYDTDTVLAKLAEPEFLTAVPDREILNPTYSPKEKKTSIINSRYLLYLGIALMLIVLGAALMISMKKIEETQE